MADHTSLQCSCCAHHASPSVHQTLDEMDFERGIWSAALDGDYERVRSFIQRATDPNKQDQAGYTALHYASRAGHHTVCELLLDHGACANSQTHGGTTPLLRAAYCGHLRVVELLLRHRADPGLTDDDGSTPLHKAAERGHVDICNLLVSKCPTLRLVKDRRLRRPADLCSGSSVLLELLKPQL